MRDLYINLFGRIQSKTFLPPLVLRPFILRYIIYINVCQNIINIPFRALPNGMVEMFLHLKGSKVHVINKYSRSSYSCFLAGIFALDYPVKFQISTTENCFKGVSITFTSRGVNKLLGVHLNELTNCIIDLKSFWKEQSDPLMHQIIHSTNDQEIIRILNNFFLSKLNENNRVDQKEIHWILRILEGKPGKATVEDMASYFDLSYKSLYRKFHAHLGLCPKTYMKILRFNRACRMLNNDPEVNWSELVYRCGYYDQAHFINEFKTLMKESPYHFLSMTKGHFYLNRPFSFK